MANLFDKTYEELLSLREDFKATTDVEAFFDGFLAYLVYDLATVLPKTQWHVTHRANNATLDNTQTDTEISADATISCQTTDFDLQADFDYANPIPKSHGSWEQYVFKKDASNTVTTLKDYITNFIKHGTGKISAADARFANVVITVSSTSYDLEPYAYKYLNKNRPVMISQFAKDLQMEFKLKLEYKEALGASSGVSNLPRIKVEFDNLVKSYDHSIINDYLDRDFEYEEFDKTAEYKDAVLKKSSGAEILTAIGIPMPLNDLDCLFELKIKAFEYDDPQIYPANINFAGPHYTTWVFKKDSYIVEKLHEAGRILSNLENNNVVSDLSPYVDYFKVYVRDSAKDWTLAVNKYLMKIRDELNVAIPPVTSPSELKLKELLNGVTWKAENRNNNATFYGGTGYTSELRQLAKDGKFFTKFVVLDGDF